MILIIMKVKMWSWRTGYSERMNVWTEKQVPGGPVCLCVNQHEGTAQMKVRTFLLYMPFSRRPEKIWRDIFFSYPTQFEFEVSGVETTCKSKSIIIW